MRLFAVSLVSSMLCLGLAFAEDQTVYVPDGPAPFSVTKKDLVRIQTRGIAGSKMTAKIEGAAKVVREDHVIALKNGKSLIGSIVREFEIQPTDTGKVTVTVTVAPPQPNVAPKVEKYEFEVR